MEKSNKKPEKIVGGKRLCPNPECGNQVTLVGQAWDCPRCGYISLWETKLIEYKAECLRRLCENQSSTSQT